MDRSPVFAPHLFLPTDKSIRVRATRGVDASKRPPKIELSHFPVFTPPVISPSNSMERVPYSSKQFVNPCRAIGRKTLERGHKHSLTSTTQRGFLRLGPRSFPSWRLAPMT